MIQSTQKVIKIGKSGGVTTPAKKLKRQNIAYSDEVEDTVLALHPAPTDQTVIDSAKKIHAKYKKDFDNLAKR